MQLSIVELNQLEQCVRQGALPDTPSVLYQYLAAIEQSTQCCCRNEQRCVQLRSYRTLLDTICDSCVAHQWRQLCLDNIYRPLNALVMLNCSQHQRQQFLRMKREVYTLGQYFLATEHEFATDQPAVSMQQWQRS